MRLRAISYEERRSKDANDGSIEVIWAYDERNARACITNLAYRVRIVQERVAITLFGKSRSHVTVVLTENT